MDKSTSSRTVPPADSNRLVVDSQVAPLVSKLLLENRRLHADFFSWSLFLYGILFAEGGDYFLAAYSIVGSTVIAALPFFSKQRAYWLKYGWVIVLASIASFQLLDGGSISAQVLEGGLMGDAESFLTGALPDASEIIELVFVGIRWAYIGYIGYSLFRAVQESRGGGDDFLALMHNPIKVAVAIPLLNFMVGLVTGGTTAA
jgi:hypothetical protein